MAGPRLQLRQSQQLVMTPQLRQAIRLLELNNLELARLLEQEVERNPLLELAPPDSDRPEPAATAPEPEAGAPLPSEDPAAAAGAFETGADNLYDAGEPFRPGSAPHTDDLPALDQTLPAPETLLDHLARQIGLMRAPTEVRRAALALAAEIDEAGYLRIDPTEAADRLGVSSAILEAAVGVLQACEPAGIAARSLAECLALQLTERDRLDPAMQALLDNLPLLARADFAALSRICGVEEDEVRDMAAELRTLDPRPGAAFSAPALPAAPPDILVRRASDGGWRVELNPDTLPRVLVNEAYAARLAASGDAQARAFVSDCRQSGAFLVRALDQRARTTLALASEIVRRQRDFLEQGVSALRPMTLRRIADDLGIHESTASRVAATKTLNCPRGTFPLRWFFSQAVQATDGGEAHSAEAIRARIRGLVQDENPRRPLSDDRLTALLREEGVDIARRTVAKYREAMNIPSSVQRRRFKTAAAS